MKPMKMLANVNTVKVVSKAERYLVKKSKSIKNGHKLNNYTVYSRKDRDLPDKAVFADWKSKLPYLQSSQNTRSIFTNEGSRYTAIAKETTSIYVLKGSEISRAISR